ncbi:hypothetical protein RJ640_025081 [Escallonia rubra]|uniref:Calmodulin-binding heat-shock protein n=1 Tax=Escallonia rubra TaxID=112253 RepID=A0AA88QQ28_9ASTE|nr:hypothetical protein RJ640_025081 [Escallonia rubra]
MPASPTALAYILITPIDHAGLYLPTKTTHPRPTPPATPTVPTNQLSPSPRPTTTGHHLPTKINYDHQNHTGERWMLLFLRAFHTVGSDDSATWASATADEFAPVPRVCRLILAAYEEDLRNPQFPPAHSGYRLHPDWVVKRVTYEQTAGHAPPYLIDVDHEHYEIVLAIRGLNLVKEMDYKLLIDNALRMQMFDGGYVHHGLLKSAIWLLNQESDTLKQMWVENDLDYKMVFAGHSLGSGVAALLTVIVVNHRSPRKKAPERRSFAMGKTLNCNGATAINSTYVGNPTITLPESSPTGSMALPSSNGLTAICRNADNNNLPPSRVSDSIVAAIKEINLEKEEAALRLIDATKLPSRQDARHHNFLRCTAAVSAS